MPSETGCPLDEMSTQTRRHFLKSVGRMSLFGERSGMRNSALQSSGGCTHQAAIDAVALSAPFIRKNG
jgi:hypothetical protein